MKIKLLIALAIILLLNGCSSWFTPNTGTKISEKEYQFSNVSGDIEERSRQLTAGVVDTLELKEESKRTVEEKVALIFASEDYRIEGSPIERIDVVSIIKQYEKENKTLMSDFQKYRDENTKLLKDKRNLNNELNSLKDKYNREQNVSIFTKIKRWFLGLGGGTIILVIIMTIIFPAPMFAFLSFIIRKIIQIFPKLIGLLGLVGKEIVYNTVEGIENIKYELKKSPDNKKYTKNEVYELIKRNLKESEKNPHHNKTIDSIKGQLKSKGKI